MVLSSVLAMKAVFADGQSLVVAGPTAQQAEMRKRRICSASRDPNTRRRISAATIQTSSDVFSLARHQTSDQTHREGRETGLMKSRERSERREVLGERRESKERSRRKERESVDRNPNAVPVQLFLSVLLLETTVREKARGGLILYVALLHESLRTFTSFSLGQRACSCSLFNLLQISSQLLHV